MSDSSETHLADDLPEGSVITGRIEIVTYMPKDGDDYMIAAKSSSNGDNIHLITALGMLELSKGLLENAQGGDE